MRLTATLALLLVPFASHAAAPPTNPDVAAFAARTLEANCAADAPGMTVLLARGDEVLYRGACGRASLELGVPLSPDHVFRIGSVTKQFAAAGVLKLAEDGKLALADPVTKHVPGYPGGDAVTVEKLLNHTSGIRSYTDIESIMSGGGIMKDLTTAQLIDTFKDEKPDFAPGEGWHYNNSGYVLVGALIEAASGKPWHVYLDEVFFQPLGMSHTGYGNEADAVIPRHVGGYSRKDDHWTRAMYLSMTQPHAAGGLVSTVDDLLRWNRALHEGRVLEDAGYRAMITPVGKAAESGYGFGIFTGTLRGEPQLWHGGGIPGFSSYLLYLPGSDITVAVLYNADSGRPGMLGTGYIANRLAAHAIGKPYPEKKAIEVDAATLAQYEGVYRIDEDAARVLRVNDGTLTSQRTGGLVHALIPVAKDTFLFEEGYSRIVFERDDAGDVAAMRFFPEDEGEGEVVPRSDEPLPPARTGQQLPREALERIVGGYAVGGMLLKVFLDGDTPMAQLTGQPAFEIFAESPSRFFLQAVDATLVFAPDTGAPASVTLHQGGRETVFVRAE
ncbi:serine hydrolase [Luteimonas viscosa]|uniref:Serine hydrolase n=1 Tax=Luteimonas viscosa TaxID=1132694 RepID=A0A5D4XPQ5_9GAMM|nr:serine hydrolase [Luteimonas viscosa]TYT26648.1 serine hydrolase [Luteimonas viscosa]